MVKIGDIFEIPLSDGRFAYGHYVYKDLKMGPIIRVSDLISEEVIQIEQLKNSTPLFPPIITGLFAAIRIGMWKIIGRIAVENFVYPNFVTAYYDEKIGKARAWYLWDGDKYTPLGSFLPEEYKELEYLLVWNPYSVVKRIETGEYVFPFRDLIRNNEYIPFRQQ